MIARLGLNIAALLFVGAFVSAPAHAQKLYKWVDKNGVTHYGDTLPADVAEREKQVLNDQGVAVKTLPRAKTKEEIEAERQDQLEQQRLTKAEEIQKERDRQLLDTYLSRDEIVSLRDSRLTSVDARISVLQSYIMKLRANWSDLEDRALRYNFPFNADSDRPPMPGDLAQQIEETERTLTEQMRIVRGLRKEQSQIRDAFARDLARFDELMARAAEDS
ncbi:MAG: DUF4124 domain-containing protein [Pseudomonadota bacterium]